MERIIMPKTKTITKREDIPNLKEAQEFIGGWVERLKLPNGDVLLFDEDGISKELPLNESITNMINNDFNPIRHVQILGNVIHIKVPRQKKW